MVGPADAGEGDYKRSEEGNILSLPFSFFLCSEKLVALF